MRPAAEQHPETGVPVAATRFVAQAVGDASKRGSSLQGEDRTGIGYRTSSPGLHWTVAGDYSLCWLLSILNQPS